MNTGLYIASFRTPLDDAKGVIMIHDQKVMGGDSGMYYIGSVSGPDNALQVKMVVTNHDPSRLSVFGEFDKFALTLNGKREGDAYVFEGRADAAPSMRFEAVLEKAAD